MARQKKVASEVKEVATEQVKNAETANEVKTVKEVKEVVNPLENIVLATIITGNEWYMVKNIFKKYKWSDENAKIVEAIKFCSGSSIIVSVPTVQRAVNRLYPNDNIDVAKMVESTHTDYNHLLAYSIKLTNNE